jgi:hypothetical protein
MGKADSSMQQRSSLYLVNQSTFNSIYFGGQQASLVAGL